MSLIVAEIAAATGSAAATRTAGSAGHGRLGCAFSDSAGAAADESLHMSAALGTEFEGSFGHFLALLEVAGAGFAGIFVGRHEALTLS